MANIPVTVASDGNRSRKGKAPLFCPFIGFEDDPTTALAYPAKYNCCFHAKPVAPVSLVQQRTFCLTEKYPECPVFLNEKQGPLPRNIRGERISKVRMVNWIPVVALVAVVVIGLVVALLTGLIPISGFNPPLANFTFATRSPEVLPVVLPSTEFTPTPEPTATTMPTATMTKPPPIKTTPRALETPFGSSPQLVIHKVAAGEGFILLAENFNTTAEAIKAINFKLPESLWENTILVIPINTDDVTGLPQFSVAEIRAEGMSIEMYAERLQLDVEQLKKFNELPEGYVLKIGELLIVPMS